MRPGRLDRILYVAPPDLASRREIFRVNFGKMAINSDVEIEELALLVCRRSIISGGEKLRLIYRYICRRMDVQGQR